MRILISLALEQVALLSDEGVAPERIIVGHLGERRHARDVLAVAVKGVFVQIDHVGRPASAGTQPEEQRARNVVEVVRAGHLEQLLLSMDICANSQMHAHGGHGFDHLLTSFVPMLRAARVSDPDITTMLVDNPRRILAF